MAYGITPQGFIPYPEANILSDLQAQAQLPAYFGPNQDVSIYDPVGQMLALMADALSNAWMGLEDAFYSLFPGTASGVCLDMAVMYGGLTRIPAQSSTVLLTASGTNGTSIASGTLYAQTSQGVQFINLSSGIVSSGVTQLYMASVLPGYDSVVAASGINQLAYPYAGITAVINPLAASGGSDIESDVALRARFVTRIQSGGSSLNAITAALQEVNGATSVYVSENITDSTASDGTPPHSIHAVVGGYASSANIAYAIFNSRAAGINTYGANSFVVTDNNGYPHTIYWDTPSQVLINVQITVTPNSNWATSSKTLLTTAAVEAVGGVDTVSGVSNQYPGVGMATNVLAWEILAGFGAIGGMDNVSVLVGIYPATPSATKITINANQYAWTQDSLISFVGV